MLSLDKRRLDKDKILPSVSVDPLCVWGKFESSVGMMDLVTNNNSNSNHTEYQKWGLISLKFEADHLRACNLSNQNRVLLPLMCRCEGRKCFSAPEPLHLVRAWRDTIKADWAPPGLSNRQAETSSSVCDCRSVCAYFLFAQEICCTKANNLQVWVCACTLSCVISGPWRPLPYGVHQIFSWMCVLCKQMATKCRQVCSH